MRGDALKGHLDLLILAVLAEGQLHGYGVIERLRSASEGAFDLAEGTVYPVLHRLENSGLLVSEWVQVSGRRRRLYALTSAGRASLGEQRSAWMEFSAAVALTLKGASWRTT